VEKVRPWESLVMLDPEEPPVRPMVEHAVRRRGASVAAVRAMSCRFCGFMGDCRVSIGGWVAGDGWRGMGGDDATGEWSGTDLIRC